MAIKHLLQAREKDLGSIKVKRLLPNSKQTMVGPWIFFDEFGPQQYAPGQGIDVKPHPHINLATVTYVFEGELLHRDSLGSVQTIEPGAVNLMVAGTGITHSERERPEIRNSEHGLHGLQLWHALPEEFEQTEPAFYHVPARQIPAAKIGDVSARVLIGEAYGERSPVKTFVDTLYFEASLPARQSLQLPIKEELALYVVAGEIQTDAQTVTARQMIVFDAESSNMVTAGSDAMIAVIGGKQMSPRVIDWNFVSSSQERIDAAVKKWRTGGFPPIPGDNKEFTPYPDK